MLSNYVKMTMEKTLARFLEQMDVLYIKGYAPKVCYDRGKAYDRDDNVQGFEILSPNRVRFDVSGTEEYEVILELDNKGDFRSTCDCPADYSVCKHQVAAMLYCMREPVAEALKDSMKVNQHFPEYLKNLSKEELIALALQYVPYEVQRKVYLQKSPAKETKAVLDVKPDYKGLHQKFDKLIDKEEYWEDPKTLEKLLDKLLEQASLHEEDYPDDASEFYKEVVEKVVEQLNNGFYWRESFSGKEIYYKGDYLLERLETFSQTLDYDRKLNFILGVLVHLQDTDANFLFDFCTHCWDFFSDAEIEQMIQSYLKDEVDSNDNEFTLQLIRNLTEVEKQEMLDILLEHTLLDLT